LKYSLMRRQRDATGVRSRRITSMLPSSCI
jgi:hypothetical protein